MNNFEEVVSYEHVDAMAALERDRAEELQRLVVAVALGDSKFEFANLLCVRLAGHRDATVRGNALLGFGHLARRFGDVSAEGRALVKMGLLDRDAHVRSHSESAADDIATFAGRLKGLG